VKGLQKMVIWFLGADVNSDSHQNLLQLLPFGPFTMFLKICMQIILWYFH